MARPAACDIRKHPVTLVSSTRRHCSSGIVSAGSAQADPGVVHEDVDPAESLDRRRDGRLDLAGLRDVAGERQALDALRCRARPRPMPSGCSRRAVIATAAPASPRPRAISSPRPRDPPVTSATLPARSKSSLTCIVREDAIIRRHDGGRRTSGRRRTDRTVATETQSHGGAYRVDRRRPAPQAGWRGRSGHARSRSRRVDHRTRAATT